MDSSTVLVTAILQAHPKQFLSCQDILSYLFEIYENKMHINTARSVLESLIVTQSDLYKYRTEKRHVTRLPVKCYSYQPPKN